MQARWRALWTALIPLLVVLGVGLACNYPTQRARPTPGLPPYLELFPELNSPPITPSAAPVLQCTPPPCGPGEVYDCPGDCPGGCGTRCATPTAIPLARACPILATRTPPPSAPTSQPGVFVDPHLELCADRLELKVGQTVTVRVYTVDLGLPVYNLVALGKDGTGVMMASVDYENKARLSAPPGLPLQVIEVSAEMRQAVFTLRAAAAGEAQLWISATGEVHYGYPGPATYTGVSSDRLVLTIR